MRAAIYTRVSSVGQQDNTSLESQEDACRALCQKQGYDVIGVFTDTHTGEDLWERPQLSVLLDQVRDGQFDVIVVHAGDRLSRSIAHRHYITIEAQRTGTKVQYVLSPHDTSTFEGKMMDSITSILSEYELIKIRERTNRGRLARAQGANGGPPKLLVGQKPLYGYRWKLDAEGRKTTYDIDEVTAPVVVRIWNEAFDGTPIRRITNDLNNDGIPSPAGKALWYASSVHNILKNPSYSGQAMAYRWKGDKVPGKGHRKQTIRKPGDDGVMLLPEGTIPPLVSIEQFEQVAERLKRNKERATRNNPNPEAALLRGGFAKCGYCGNNLMAKKVTYGYGYLYCCSGRNRDRYGCSSFGMQADVLDQAVWSVLFQTITTPDALREQLNLMIEAEEGTGCDRDTGESAVIKRQLADIQRQRDRLVSRLAMLDDDRDASQVAEQINGLAARRKSLESELADLSETKESKIDWDYFDSELEAWSWQWTQQAQGADYAWRRYLLDLLGVKVRVWATDHDPRYDVTADVPLAAPTSEKGGGSGHILSKSLAGPPGVVCARPTGSRTLAGYDR